MPMNKKIKIFVDAHCFDTEYQGTQTFLRGLYSELISKFPLLDIHFGAHNTERIKNEFPLLDQSRILKYRFRNKLRLVSDIPYLLRKHQFEWAHFQNLAPTGNNNCRYIVTLHDVLFEDYKNYFPLIYRKIRRVLFKSSFKKASIKTTVSDYSRQRISFHYNIPENEIEILSNGVSQKRYFIHKKEAEEHIAVKFGITNFILCVSRIEPRKNHSLLIKIFEDLNLHYQKTHLVFIGKRSLVSNEYESRLRLLTPEHKKYIHWFEQVDDCDLEAFYNSCRFFVYPSMAEGFGIPPLEAAIHGTPVLCSSLTAMGSFNFFEPFTFDPCNYQEFRSKFKGLLEQIPSKNKLHSISQKILAQYNWEKSANKFYRLVQPYS